MNEIYPLREYFRKVYIVDLSPSLCNVARERIRRLHLSDLVYVLCDDAVTFELPDFPNAEGHVDLITMSYSLSMMPSYTPARLLLTKGTLRWLIRLISFSRLTESLVSPISTSPVNIPSPIMSTEIME